MQKSGGNRATTSLARTFRRHFGGRPRLQRMRNHDYGDTPIRQIAQTQQAALQIAQTALTNAAPLQYTLPPGFTSQNISQMGALKAQVRQALVGANVNGNLNNILGSAYNLDVGLHRLSIWSVPAGAAPILQFDVAVIPNGGTLVDAQNADAAWGQTVANLTYMGAVARPFRENHVIDPVPVNNYELALAAVAVHRQKASTLIQLTAQAETNLVNEVRGHIQGNTYTTTRHFVTVAQYPMLDIDPSTNPATLKTFDANFEYDVFHNPQTKLWQISHFHGPQNVANLQQIGQATVGVGAAITKTGDALAFVAPTAGLHIPPGNYQMRFRQNRALVAVRVQIDDNPWKNAERDNVIQGDWLYDWAGYRAGRHTVRIEGQEQHGRRTNRSSLTVQVP